jgi:hypothetical protein
MKSRKTVMFLLSATGLIASQALAAPSVAVTVTLDDLYLRPGQTTLARVYGQVLSPASSTDGIFTYDLNVGINPTTIVTPVAASVNQPNSESPSSPGTLSSSGLAASYGTYFLVQNRGISSPQELVNFSIQGATVGTATLTVSGDTTIGDDFLLHESAPPAVNYAAATQAISVRAGDEWKGPAGGNFNTASSWVGSTVPGGASAIADFLTGITAASTVTLASPVTLGVVRFDNTKSYSLAGSAITLQASSGKAYAIGKSGSHSVSSAITVASDTEFNIRAGTVSFSGNLSSSAARALTKTGAGTLILNSINGLATGSSLDIAAGAVQLGPNVSSGGSSRISTLNISSGTARLGPRSGGPAQVLRLQNLSVGAASALDLYDNDLVVNNGSFSALEPLVLGGYRGGLDTSATGIVSTSSQTIHGGATILALFDNALAGFSDYPAGSGQTISANAIVGKYTYIGDTNMDGQVTPQDYTATDSNLGTSVDPAISWFYGDTNFDGNIDATDYAGIDGALGLGQGNPLASHAMGSPAVPEPAFAGMLAAGLLMSRRRRTV